MTDTELTKMLRSSANRVVNYAADRIEQLTAERDVSNELGKALEEDAGQLREKTARLRELLAEADNRIVWESLGFGNDFADEVQAALKGESHE